MPTLSQLNCDKEKQPVQVLKPLKLPAAVKKPTNHVNNPFSMIDRKLLVKNVFKERRQRAAKNHVNPDHPIDVDKLVSTGSSTTPKPWIPELGLTKFEKNILQSSTDWLNDRIINAAQKLLRKVNPCMPGLQDVVCGRTMSFDVEPGEFLQILHDKHGHWLTISTVGLAHPEVMIFDSLYPSISTSVKMQIACLLYTKKPQIKLLFKDVQIQSGGSDCGLFSIAFATAITFGKQPEELVFTQSEMRPHLLHCLESQEMTMFPLKKSRKTAKIPIIDVIPIFCVCRMPEFTNSHWIECSTCKEWYHSNTCVTVSKKYFSTKLPWYCTDCSQSALNQTKVANATDSTTSQAPNFPVNDGPANHPDTPTSESVYHKDKGTSINLVSTNKPWKVNHLPL